MDANAAFVHAMRKEFPNLTILDVTTTFHGENMSRWGDVYQTRDNVVLMVFRTPENKQDVLQYLRTHTGVRDQTAFADLRWVCMHRSVLLPSGPMPNSGADLRLVSNLLRQEGIEGECPICFEQYTPIQQQHQLVSPDRKLNGLQTPRPAVRLSSNPHCLHVLCGPCATELLQKRLHRLQYPPPKRLDHIKVECPQCRQEHKLKNNAMPGSSIPKFLFPPAYPVPHQPNSHLQLNTCN